MEQEIDATEELVKQVEEVTDIRPVKELVNVPYEELTEEEKEYLISALKMHCQEREKMTQRALKESDRLKQIHQQELNKIANTLTFIKSLAIDHASTITLAIKDIEREVNHNGN